MNDYERGAIDGARQALEVLHGHNINDTAHDRVRRLLQCAECAHMPDDHRQWQECTATQFVSGPPPMPPCPCAEYKSPMLLEWGI